MIKFSIIIPIYNRAKYIQNTLNSIFIQEYENLEVICINDCSTDNSLSIVNMYANNNDKIKVINNKTNKGTHVSRKIAVQHAIGDYILYLDCDDMLTNNSLKCLNKYLNKNDDILEFSYQIISKQYICKPDQIINIKNLFDSFVYFKHPRSGSLCNKVYKTKLLKYAYLKTKDFYSIMGEDLYMSIIIAYYAKSYTQINDLIYLYDTETGVSQKKKDINSLLPHLNSIKNNIEALKLFFKTNAPIHLKAVQNIENNFLDYIYYSQILKCVKQSEWKNAINLLPEYFSEKALAPYLKIINSSIFIIKIDFLFYKMNKFLRRLTPQPIKNFIKKYLNLKQI